jgi:hypothetical protein
MDFWEDQKLPSPSGLKIDSSVIGFISYELLMHRHHAMRPDGRLQDLVPFGRYEEQVRIGLACGFNYGSKTRGLHHARIRTLTKIR